MSRKAWRVVALAFALGATLRIVHLTAWPPGPWIDEAYALRASRLLPPGAPLFGTSALTPPGEGFVNAYTSNLYLAFARAVDVAAGGGLASFRALSLIPSLALLAALLLLASEAAGPDLRALLPAALLGATSMWLLTTGRWGWDAVATSALATGATWASLRAARTRSLPFALLAGVLVGLGAYGYAAGRLFLAAPVAVLVWSSFRRGPGRENARLAAVALAAAAVVVLPLALHLARQRDRLFPREKELSIFRPAAGGAARAVLDNVRAYAALFFLHGDRNERHGDPSRPVLPPAVSALALVGAAAGLARGGPARALVLPAALFLAGGLLAWEDTGANAYRVSPAAPFLLVLAGLGAAALLDALPERVRRAGGWALAVVVLVAAAADVLGFAAWGSSPRAWGAFGGWERELADAYRAASATGPARLVLDPHAAARNPYVVEELLAPAGARRGPVLFFADLSKETTRLVEPVLYADGGALLAAFGGRRASVLASGRDPWGRPTFTLYRLSPEPLSP